MKFLVRDLFKYISRHIQKKNKPGNSSIQRFYATSQRHLLLLVKKKTVHTEIDALGSKLIIGEMEMSSKETISENIQGWGGGFHLYYFVNIL